jgi:hypothetical protein
VRQQLVHQQRGPEQCFDDAEHAHPERGGMLNLIDRRADNSQAVDAA